MKTRFFILVSALAFLSINASAQKDSTIIQPGQVSFVYPMSTAGTNSANQKFHFSLNVIGGINAGVDGFECASVFNINNGDFKGAQFSGIFNHTNGNSEGAKFAGISNYTTGNTYGATFAGVINQAQNVQGVQGATINNAKKVQGAQLGVINIAQTLGDKKSPSVQAGVINISDTATGAKMGVVNVSNETIGSQVGVINTSGKAKGVQVGLVNISGDMKGTKVGLINISDSLTNGVAVGLINIAKNGYYALEISTNEMLFANATFKMGMPKLYGMLSFGVSQYNDKDVFSWGAGMGTLFSLTEKSQLQLELMSDQIVYDNFKDYDYDFVNHLTSFNFSYRYNFNSCLSVAVGPTLNSYITNAPVNGEYGTLDVPYTIYEHTCHHEQEHYKQSIWIGAKVGVTIKL